MSERYLIKTIGHCGSMLVKAWLSNNQNCQGYGYEEDGTFTPENPDFKDKNNMVLHGHSYWLPKISPEWHFIHVCRRDTFSQIISSLVAEYTNQSVTYDDAIFEPITVPYHRLDYKIQYVTYWNKIFELQSSSFDWKRKHKIYFEDFVDNNDYLDILRYTTETKSFYNNPKISHKNPRKQNEVIKNYYELLDYYNKKNKTIKG